MASSLAKVNQSVQPLEDRNEFVPRGKSYSLKASRVRERREQVEGIDTAPASRAPRPRDEVIANATVHFKNPDHAIDVISALWNEARQKFLAIGRNLREAKFRYPQAFEKTILPRLPFGKQVAYQLRIVADAVDRGRLIEHEMPQSYGAAYQLANLDETELKQAHVEGLVRPNVQRRSIEEWKRERELQRRIASEGRGALLREERINLHGEAAKLRERLSMIESRLSEIDGEIGTGMRISSDRHLEAEGEQK